MWHFQCHGWYWWQHLIERPNKLHILHRRNRYLQRSFDTRTSCPTSQRNWQRGWIRRISMKDTCFELDWLTKIKMTFTFVCYCFLDTCQLLCKASDWFQQICIRHVTKKPHDKHGKWGNHHANKSKAVFIYCLVYKTTCNSQTFLWQNWQLQYGSFHLYLAKFSYDVAATCVAVCIWKIFGEKHDVVACASYT